MKQITGMGELKLADKFQIYALRQSKLYDIRKAIYTNNIKYYFDELIIGFIQSYFGQIYV
ncbi:hypothetical protein VUJ46_06655 [Chryseobacterium sp. MYb264]|uniref:hypothetical protein n=1 Tax=Chryseobacterium sp. MYb264 TaxID=2745153 RepID=UPI002E15722C|nr:hypothetical protein VUJ46_06655 [Chryseobacterium sp. MYb264]